MGVSFPNPHIVQCLTVCPDSERYIYIKRFIRSNWLMPLWGSHPRAASNVTITSSASVVMILALESGL